ncbi:MAG: hypothetical protein LAO76_17595 [Acidobacteriia bacterium]|nr:hypothetical protein [Terriglobia bacterium]
MAKLRASVDASPTTQRRWVWELIQNAKDVNIDGKVRVRIEADLEGTDAHVTFKHNGGPFSPENIRFLIEQVSSKDRTNDSDGRPTTTGKFGTGFLTTHLLSERVLVRGVAEGRGFTPRKFKLSLDRSGDELQDIIDAVQAAKDSILDLDDQPEYTGYVPGKFNTAFRYELADKTARKVASAGLADLDICLPYTLSFVREIESIEYPNRRLNLQNSDGEQLDGEVQILSVTAADPEGFADPEVFSIAVLSSGLTTIALPVKQTSNGVLILPLGPDVPRLFCDFPLLGRRGVPVPGDHQQSDIQSDRTTGRRIPHQNGALHFSDRPQQTNYRAGARALPLAARIRVGQRLAKSSFPRCGKAGSRGARAARSAVVQDRDPQADTGHAPAYEDRADGRGHAGFHPYAWRYEQHLVSDGCK